MRMRDALDLLLLSALWGASFLFMRIAAPEFGAVALAALRLGIAALLLLPLALLNQHGRALAHHWKPLGIMGLLTAGLPFLCYSYAALTLPSGVSALVNTTTPLWGAIIAWVWLREPLTVHRSLGLIIGFAGALVLLWTPLPASGASTHLAFLAALAAPLFYGMAATYSRRYLSHTPALVNAGGSLGSAAVLLLVPAWQAWPQQPVSWQAWLSVILLASLSTAFAYVVFFRLLNSIGPVRTVTATYLVPLFGLGWGALLLDETVTANMLLAGGITLAGTTLATGILPRRRTTPTDKTAP